MKCRIENCDSIGNVSGTAKGLCRSHYKRYLRYGDPQAPLRKIQRYGEQKCAVRYCENLAASKNLCEKHYVAKRRGDDPTVSKRASRNYAIKQQKKREKELGRIKPINCEVCKLSGYEKHNKPDSGIVYDHNHLTGKGRGWLCDRCNKVLGMVKDSSHLLNSLATYVENDDVKINE